jgi:hypothetical protein
MAVESAPVPLVLLATAVMELAPTANVPAGSVARKMPEPAAVSVAVAISTPLRLNLTVEPAAAVTLRTGVAVET